MIHHKPKYMTKIRMNKLTRSKQYFIICIFLFAIFPNCLGQSKEQGLKDYYHAFFPIGVAVNPPDLAGPSAELIKKEFSSLSPANALKMAPIHPEENRYNWEQADKIVDFAKANGMTIHGHVLCWHSQAPAWIFTDTKGDTVTKEVLLQRLKKHIFDVVSRYKGRIVAWDVVNEAIADEEGQFYRKNTWFRICGEDYIEKAFEYAHEADPQAILFYNDYNTEIPQKRDKVYRLLKQLLEKHVPVNGVGLQGHWSIYEPSEKDLRDALDKYSSLNLNIIITELDVSVYPPEANPRSLRPNETLPFTPELETKQMNAYKMFFKVFRDYKKVITGVTFWGVSDRVSWLNNFPVRGRINYPLLFDRDLKRKQAYQAITEF
jgi:endo-1,4-beta-xylanase